MNYQSVSLKFKLLDEPCDCENWRPMELHVTDYFDLEDKLINLNYDIIPNNIIIDVRILTKTNNNLIEEALATPKSLVLVSDFTEIPWENAIFLVKWFCNQPAIIEVKGDKKYCKKCFHSDKNIDEIINLLKSKDPKKGLPTSKKIQYILLENSPEKLSVSEIYNKGMPWEMVGLTPKNSIAARCSTLFYADIIQKKGKKYFI